jgi:hypothetical protein
MTRAKAKVGIVLVISAQLLAAALWVLVPKFGSGPPGGAYSYRAEPRMHALSERYSHPSPETIAAWEHELQLLEAYKLRHLLLKIALALALNATLIYFLWSHADKQTMA